MKYILLSLFFCAIAPCNINSQDISTINIHLLSNKSNDLKFNYKYEIDGKGENAIGKTIFENTISLSHIRTSNDTLIFNIEADSTRTSNMAAMEDGEASLLFAMIGLNMKLKCNSNGELIEILNKEEIISELKQGIQGMSEERKEGLVQNMLAENETLLFHKMYEINYALLLTFISQELSVPFEHKKDSLITETIEMPKSTIETIQKNTKLGDKITFRKTVTQKSAEFTQNEAGYVIISKPVISNMEQLIITDISGLLQKVSSKTIIKREGMTMKRDGNIMNEMKPLTQYFTMEYLRIE